MAEGDNVLHFSPRISEDDNELKQRILTSYSSVPPFSQADVERCITSVLAQAGEVHGERPRNWKSHIPRQRWWWGAAAAAVVVAVTMRPWRVAEFTRGAETAFAVTEGPRVALAEAQGTITQLKGEDAVRFDLRLPGSRADVALDVALVGDFNGWDERATPMLRRKGDGTWSAEVELAPGRHVYAFVVNGESWLVDPLAPQVPDAGYGPANAVMVEGSR